MKYFKRCYNKQCKWKHEQTCKNEALKKNNDISDKKDVIICELKEIIKNQKELLDNQYTKFDDLKN